MMLGLLIPACVAQAQAQPANEIVWTLTPLPPAMVEQDDTIVGYGVDTLDWFIDRLPAYRHTKEIVPLPRLMQLLTGDQTVCNVGLTPTPDRRKILLFSDAVLPHLPVSLVVQSKDNDRIKPYLDANQHIDLDKLIKAQKLEGAVRTKRYYGPTIAPILTTYADSPVMTSIGTDAHFLEMITLGRIDWTLFFPAELEYHRRTTTPDTQFTSWAVAGNDHLMQASIACTKTQTGQAVVRDVNLLVEKHPDMPWIGFYQAALSPQDRQRYAQNLSLWQQNRKDVLN